MRFFVRACCSLILPFRVLPMQLLSWFLQTHQRQVAVLTLIVFQEVGKSAALWHSLWPFHYSKWRCVMIRVFGHISRPGHATDPA
ncbi:hypothetical protein F5B18DRAFT_609820 [Nemania serpens]|nr:hypothetical protein F5B18DRAFT_609820 [Nemania serpens]